MSMNKDANGHPYPSVDGALSAVTESLVHSPSLWYGTEPQGPPSIDLENGFAEQTFALFSYDDDGFADKEYVVTVTVEEL